VAAFVIAAFVLGCRIALAQSFTIPVLLGMLSTRHLVVVLPDGARKSVTYTGRAVRVAF